jgi:hypothetical protein
MMGGYFKDNVLSMLRKILSNQEKIMSGLDDANAALGALQAEELQIVEDFQTLLTQNEGDPDAAVEAIANQVTAVTAALKAGDPVPTVTPPATPTS